MKLVAISDTHGRHREVVLPAGDIIIHAGDLSRNGTEAEVADFLDWFKDLPFDHKVFIAGNHDFFFEQASEEQVRNIIPPGVTYLEDSAVEIEGYRIWGSPITPSFYDWAFNRERGADIRAGWELIPAETDILIVHGPPYSILDKTYRGAPVGCRDLLGRVSEIEPAVFICGHIHEAYGMLRSKETTFINCSQVNLAYEIANPPVVIDLGLKNRDE